MLILGLDSSAVAASAAVTDMNINTNRILAYGFVNVKTTHSQTLMPLAESILKSAGLSPADMDGFAVSNGPGSFTGIRIGVSAVKGMAFALNKPVCGVSTLLALAYNLVGINRPVPKLEAAVSQPNSRHTSLISPQISTDIFVEIASSDENSICEPTHFEFRDRSNIVACPVMDARRGEVYNALFEVSGSEVSRLTPDRAISLDDLGVELTRYSRKNIVLVGDGAELAYSYFKGKYAIASEIIRHQNAASVCFSAKEFIPSCELMPVYIRKPQAERERESREKIRKE